MGIRPYIEDDLRAGRLVAPFALSIPSGEQWFLIYRAFRAEELGFAAFRTWLHAAAQSSRRDALPPQGQTQAKGRRSRSVRAG
jgi:LysR family transcriptional regulator, glycine cleavage system transcriptional activator